MLKLLTCLIFAIVMGVITLQIRQERLELNFQTNRLHNQIRDRQALLWDQQLRVAVYTAPSSLQRTVEQQNFQMVPEPLPNAKGRAPAAGGSRRSNR